MNRRTITLQCNPDTSLIGSHATTDELDQYHANLSALIEREFGVTVHQVTTSGRDDCPESKKIHDRIRQIESSDEWIELL